MQLEGLEMIGHDSCAKLKHVDMLHPAKTGNQKQNGHARPEQATSEHTAATKLSKVRSVM